MAVIESTAMLVARRYVRGTAIAALAIPICWHLLYDGTMTVLGWSVYRWPWVVAVCWVAYLAIGVTGALDIFGRARPHLFWPLTAAALSVVAIVLAMCPPEEILRSYDWAWGAIGWLGVIICWRRPISHLVGFLLANTAIVVIGLAIGDQLDRITLARLGMVLIGSSALQLGFAFTAGGVRTIAASVTRSAIARAEVADRRAVAEAVHAARVARYEDIRDDIRGLLTELADGADPGDPLVQQRCRAGAARLRRLLAETDDVPDPLLHGLRAGADVAERRGVEVSLVRVGTLPDLSVETCRALSEAPIEALSNAATWARVTVVGSGDEVVVSVIGDMPDAPIAHRPGVEITAHTEGERRWIEARWSLQPAA
ncbi:hypothetical protein [Catenuloplanes atrovinosus]|uniref:Uncharacterized protein n=1 Tax=Catenuloplanes atrovinosus TaxID=137266 RepID=A0AAE3YXN9_9ACTN|nr:hypothetical protein [Catenuloplanes atrovinosus]MDR7279846.1 hypothetical protein [Catenuloplanes atrovinosus]